MPTARVEVLGIPQPTETSGASYDENRKPSLTLFAIRTSTDESYLWTVVRTAYDENGRAIATSDPLVVWNDLIPTDSSFNPANDDLRQPDGTTTFDPADHRATYTEYDDAGRVTHSHRVETVPVEITRMPTGTGFYTFEASFDEGSVAGNELSTSETVYDTFGRVDRTISADNLVTEYGYDELGRQETVTVDPSDTFGLYAQTVTEYDTLGRQETVTDANGVVTRFVYDAAGRVIQTIADEGNLDVVTETKYDDAGRRIAEIDALDQRTDFDYDASGRLIGVQLPMVQDKDPNAATAGQWVNPTYTYGYDIYGNQTSITDARGNVTEFTYDHLGRQLSRTLPEGQTETFEYDELGRQVRRFSFEGRTVDFIYDDLGRLDKKHYFTSEPAFAPGLGDDEGVDHDVDEAVDYVFDMLGRTTGVIQDFDGDLLTTADQRVTYNTYDAEGRLESVASDEGAIFYDYDNLGRLVSTKTQDELSPTTGTAYAYDELGRLETVAATHRNGVDIPDETTTYRYVSLRSMDERR